MAAVVLPVLCATALTGCGVFSQLKKEVKSVREDSRVVGQITNISGSPTNVHVVVWTSPRPDEVVIVDHATPNSNGLFVFLLPSGPDYFIGAMEDTNGNDQYDPGEPVWLHGKPDPIPVGIGKSPPRMAGRLGTGKLSNPGITQALRKARGGRKLIELKSGQEISVAAGDIADLNQPRFSAEMGGKGLWEPVTYMKTAHPGVYFLKPYNPSKIPVLFVYGAGGSVQDWRYFLKNLDRRRYQPWFYQYPSGLRLAQSARQLDLIIQSIHRRYPFKRLDVVAHSMGGLMARDYVLRGDRSKKPYLNKLITISTPWNGHRFASLGVDLAPEAVPSWRDVQSESSFIQRVLNQPMPLTHHLIYGTKSKRSVFLPDKNDGSVAVESMADPRAVSKATTIDHYNHDHTGILKSSEVLKKVETYLAQP